MPFELSIFSTCKSFSFNGFSFCFCDLVFISRWYEKKIIVVHQKKLFDIVSTESWLMDAQVTLSQGFIGTFRCLSPNVRHISIFKSSHFTIKLPRSFRSFENTLLWFDKEKLMVKNCCRKLESIWVKIKLITITKLTVTGSFCEEFSYNGTLDIWIQRMIQLSVFQLFCNFEVYLRKINLDCFIYLIPISLLAIIVKSDKTLYIILTIL